MSYIIPNTAFVRFKLTEKGRERLALGQLNFSSWSAGDSEVDYINPTSDSRVLRPKDDQHSIKYFLTKSDGDAIHPLSTANIRTLKVVVNNEAAERGFFTGDLDAYTANTTTNFIKASGVVDTGLLDGSDTIDIGTTDFSDGDFVLFVVTSPTLGALTLDVAEEPVPYLWFKIQSSAGSVVTLDRNIPIYSGTPGTDVQFIVYPGGSDPVNDFYGSATTTSYWNTGTLTFDASCDISVADVSVWNQNNVWCENLIGINPATDEGYTDFGSSNFTGSKVLMYDRGVSISGLTQEEILCDVLGFEDEQITTVAILHYTNNTISNFYGEFFFVDEDNGKLLTLDLPGLMYHRRAFSGSTTGNQIGMRFVSDGTLKTVENTDLEYYDLVESSVLTVDSKAEVVGRIFPTLKVITIDDEELVAAISYKSNRSWTLPKLSVNTVAPATGQFDGILEPEETLYMTYVLKSGGNLLSGVHQQDLIRVTNNSATDKDIEFRLENIDLLPYMRKIEAGGYDGRGFHADQFSLLVQKVASATDRPDSESWTEIDFTSGITGFVAGETIDPLGLELQNSGLNDFILTNTKFTGGTTYDLSYLNIPLTSEPTLLQFGDERFFYGNINTFIGATVYKTVFDIAIDGKELVDTTNPTKDASNTTELFLSEVAIYDSEDNLVLIGKLSTPISFDNTRTINLELSIDF